MMFMLGIFLIVVSFLLAPVHKTKQFTQFILVIGLSTGVGVMVSEFTIMRSKLKKMEKVKAKAEVWTYDLWLPFAIKDIPNEGNNPGCITAGYDKYDTLAIGFVKTGNYKFLVFPDSATGWKALRMRIEQSKDENVISFLKNYCVNIPESYIFAVLAATGGKETDNVGDLNPEIIARTIAKYEGWKKGKDYPLKKL